MKQKYNCACWINFNKLIYNFGFCNPYKTKIKAENLDQAKDEARNEFFMLNPDILYLVTECKCEPENNGDEA